MPAAVPLDLQSSIPFPLLLAAKYKILLISTILDGFELAGPTLISFTKTVPETVPSDL